MSNKAIPSLVFDNSPRWYFPLPLLKSKHYTKNKIWVIQFLLVLDILSSIIPVLLRFCNKKASFTVGAEKDMIFSEDMNIKESVT